MCFGYWILSYCTRIIKPIFLILLVFNVKIYYLDGKISSFVQQIYVFKPFKSHYAVWIPAVFYDYPAVQKECCLIFQSIPIKVLAPFRENAPFVFIFERACSAFYLLSKIFSGSKNAITIGIITTPAPNIKLAHHG